MFMNDISGHFVDDNLFYWRRMPILPLRRGLHDVDGRRSGLGSAGQCLYARILYMYCKLRY